MAVRSRGPVLVLSCALFIAAVGVSILTSHLDTWPTWTLLVIAGFTFLSDAMAAKTDVEATFVSGSFLGIVLTAVLCGGAPAAALGTATICLGWLRFREPAEQFLCNLANYAWYPLAAGLAFHALLRASNLGPSDPVFYLGIFAVFGIALVLNVLGPSLYVSYSQRRPLSLVVSEMLGPVLAAELFSALLTVAAAYVAIRLHLSGLILFGLVLIVFQYLVGELLTSRRRQAKLRRVATTDELTGLPNREAFRNAVDARIVDGGAFAVLLMDLDRFKDVNDTLGHAHGDVLLAELAPRLHDAIGRADLVARLGGDEFAVLLSDNDGDPAQLELPVSRLLRAIAEPVTVDELSLEVGASIGVARFPGDGSDSHSLLRCADIAMYAAKDAQSDYSLYDEQRNRHSTQRLSIISDIRRALARDEIVVHYQPIVDLDRRTVTGAEGLVRWEHSEQGLIPPGAFIPSVEQTGLIGPLTRHVLERAIVQCAAWRADGQDLSVAVNLSVRNLLDHDLPRAIERMLDAHHLPADALRLEITESMLMSDPERSQATVGRLSELGARLSVDDFGTGYSSLAKLRSLPIDELKIDRSFVSPMLRDESDLIIVRSTINLGHDLGLSVIAEGVEDADVLERLADLGCDRAQGYHLSRPISGAAFSEWMTAGPYGAAPVGLGVPPIAGAGLIAAAPER